MMSQDIVDMSYHGQGPLNIMAVKVMISFQAKLDVQSLGTIN